MCKVYRVANMNIIKVFKKNFVPDVSTWGARQIDAEWGRGRGWCLRRPPRPCARAWRRSRKRRRAGSPAWSGIPRESESTTCCSCVVDAGGPGLPHCVLELTEEMGAHRPVPQQPPVAVPAPDLLVSPVYPDLYLTKIYFQEYLNCFVIWEIAPPLLQPTCICKHK